MSKFRKKPLEIEARRFCSTIESEQEELASWCNGKLRGIRLRSENRVIQIETREGEVEAEFGDWIICGVKGEFYPCKADIFDLSYEEIPNDPNPRA